MDPSNAVEIVSLVKDGGGLVVLGWVAHAALRLMKKAEEVLDATAVHRAKVVAHHETVEKDLGALTKALA